MSSQPNRLKPNTTALAMLRRGWILESPDQRYRIYIEPDKNHIDIFHNESGEWLGDFPITPDGFEAMMNEVVNPPF